MPSDRSHEEREAVRCAEMTMDGLTLTKGSDGYWLNFTSDKGGACLHVDNTFSETLFSHQLIRDWARQQKPRIPQSAPATLIQIPKLSAEETAKLRPPIVASFDAMDDEVDPLIPADRESRAENAGRTQHGPREQTNIVDEFVNMILAQRKYEAEKQPPSTASGDAGIRNYMKPFQQRVVSEVRELRGNLDKLNQFVQTEMFNQLPSDEKDRLMKQRGLMDEYAAVLDDRIANFFY